MLQAPTTKLQRNFNQLNPKAASSFVFGVLEVHWMLDLGICSFLPRVRFVEMTKPSFAFAGIRYYLSR